MASIAVKKVTNDRELKDFIKFPNNLYKENSNYVPPLNNDEKNIWNAKENPALSYSDAEQYLAYRNGEVVGRIALIVNYKEEKELGIKKLRFGWLDFIDDIEVSKVLMDKAIEVAKSKNLPKIEGPMGFTNLDKAGMLVMGFDKLATMIGIYNFDYYPTHLEQLGLKKEKEWVEFEIDFPEQLPEKITKFSGLIKEKYKLKVLRFNHKKKYCP